MGKGDKRLYLIRRNIMEKINKEFDIQQYLANGVEKLVSEAVRATLKNPAESIFMAKFAASAKRASAKRKKLEQQGEHIPPFLIASITSKCNLHCAGCYSRCNDATNDNAPTCQLTSEQWQKIFDEASSLGISFILLAGGEPLLRRDVIETAAKNKEILFPIFTNGTFLDDKYIKLFDKCRNLVPIMSIEGEKEQTDSRRGEGVYDKLISNMQTLHKKGVIFGVSITVTTENIEKVSSDAFLQKLSKLGCKAVIFVEFVPVSEGSQHLAVGDEQREYLANETARLREQMPDMVFVSFPGDEKSSGGCLAAGRGFFHINSHGGAEPCPFSPYSDINVKDTSLRQALSSDLFRGLREGGLLNDDHKGGCVLYEKRSAVQQLLGI